MSLLNLSGTPTKVEPPQDNQLTKPIKFFVFVNKKSGGGQGKKIMKKMQHLLGTKYVVDLVKDGPEKGILASIEENNKFLQPSSMGSAAEILSATLSVPSHKAICPVRLIVAGGDGTVAWVLSALDKTGISPKNLPPCCILPLGTGNDMSRSLGFGAGMKGHENLSKIIDSLSTFHPNTILFDRWKLTFTPELLSSSGEIVATSKLPQHVISDASKGVKANKERSNSTGKSLELSFSKFSKSAEEAWNDMYKKASSWKLTTNTKATTKSPASSTEEADSPSGEDFDAPSLSKPQSEPIISTQSRRDADSSGSDSPSPIRHHSLSKPVSTGKIESENSTPSIKTETPEKVMNLYFSCGLDAQIAKSFDSLREKSPHLFVSRLFNQSVYAGYGLKYFLQQTESMKKVLNVWADGKLVAIPNDIRSVIVLNSPSYGGGMDMFSRTSDPKPFVLPTLDDGKLEIVGFKDSFHAAMIKSKLAKGIRLGQASAITISYGIDQMPMQLDGEPWFGSGPQTIRIMPLRSAKMLYLPKSVQFKGISCNPKEPESESESDDSSPITSFGSSAVGSIFSSFTDLGLSKPPPAAASSTSSVEIQTESDGLLGVNPLDIGESASEGESEIDIKT